MNIGERLKEERERLGLTQVQFAALCGASKRSQIEWEKGGAYPNAKALSDFAKAGADVGYILTGKRAEEIREALAAYTPRQVALMELFGSLDEGSQAEIFGHAQEKKRIADLEKEVSELKRKRK